MTLWYRAKELWNNHPVWVSVAIISLALLILFKTLRTWIIIGLGIYGLQQATKNNQIEKYTNYLTNWTKKKK